VVLRSASALRHWGEQFAGNLGPGSVVGLSGPLGAGKTTLSQGLLKGLGVTDQVTSPTYALIQDYQGRVPVHHMDLYRLSGPEEFELIGGFDAMNNLSVCVIEWVERLDGCLPEGSWLLTLSLLPRGRRVKALLVAQKETT